MPIELSDTLKNTFGMSFASRGLNNLFCSKIYTTIILTIIIIILIIIIYPCKKGTPFWVVGKLGLYIFISTLVVLFVHNGIVYESYKKEISGDEDDEFVNNVIDGKNNVAFNSENMTVKPKIDNGSSNSDVISVRGGNDVDNQTLFEMYGV